MPPQRVPFPLIGASSKLAAQQSARTVNLTPRFSTGDAKAVVALHHAPGYFRWADLTELISGIPQIRGMHIMQGRFFVVVSEKVYEVLYDETLAAFNTLTEYATLSTSSGRVGLSDNSGKLVIGDGKFWALDVATSVLSAVRNDDEEQLEGTFSGWIDGFTIYPVQASGKFYYSAINDPLTVNGLDYATAEGDPDPTVALLISNREIVFLGERTTEWWGDSGGSDNAFERIAGGFVEHGCSARWSARVLSGRTIFVGRNREGEGGVWMATSAGAEPVRVSSGAVQESIEKVLFNASDLREQITAITFENSQGSFYALNLPPVPATTNSPAQASMTWLYNPGVPADFAWTELAYTNPDTGQFERILSDHHVTWRGRHYTGAYNLAHIYEMSLNYYRENTLPLVKFRESAGPLNMQGRRFSLNKLIIEMEVGVGRDGGVQGSDPQMMLQYSWDGGKNWSDEIWRSIGKIGETDTRVEFNQLGSGYNFVSRHSISDPVRVTLLPSWADVTVHK